MSGCLCSLVSDGLLKGSFCWARDFGVRKVGLLFCVKGHLDGPDRVVVIEFVISCPWGQVRGETSRPPLSLLEGRNGVNGFDVEK